MPKIVCKKVLKLSERPLLAKAIFLT